ncbi:Macrolide export ATP-binding/permease protein MacB [Methanosarcinaceae archaeon Ag5]|uniref:Macrolide export ATP-binding/permease protein MacB n=1 Tax=Methanolapillus africanus TaxID=3028297 RepID=A0AAE4MKI5_9EURY|nr:Macrolide export ATP-binding/permease protein MacB [Methanosarcinaceae archaeon Ag5]
MIGLHHSMKMGLASLKSAKMRSGLTALGIIIGIAAVVATFTLGSSFGAYFSEQISSSGSNYIMIISEKENLFFDQQVQVVRNTPGVTGASPVNSAAGVVTFMGEEKNVTAIYGVTEDYAEIASMPMQSGSFISDKDTSSIVIGKKIAQEEFKNEITTRSTVTLTVYNNETKQYITETFKVKGISGSNETNIITGGEVDNAIYIPLDAAKRLSGRDDYYMIFAMTESSDDVQEVADDVEVNLARNLGVSERYLNNPEYDDLIPFMIMNQAEILEQVQQIIQTMQIFLAGIGGISLVVGSVGIMNIMLVTVTERTKEIGTLKALGYSSKDVLLLFVTEAIMISSVGGAVGVLLGLLAGYVGATLMGFSMGWSITVILAGIGISIVIGVIAGVYPANKAAKMNPVDALRSD